MRMRTQRLILTIFLVCVGFCLSACKDWRNYSLDFQPGDFNIKDYKDDTLFTPESKIVLSLTEPLEVTNGFVTSIDGDAYFVFYNVTDGVKDIDYGYAAERSITFYVEMQDGNKQNFTLYAYDWKDKIYCMGHEFYFEAE